MISGSSNQLASLFWAGFDAAHIFPLENEDLWIEQGYGRWITDMDDTAGVSGTHSLQNGLFSNVIVHQLFDMYLLSVNPDVCVSSRFAICADVRQDNYKVGCLVRTCLVAMAGPPIPCP